MTVNEEITFMGNANEDMVELQELLSKEPLGTQDKRENEAPEVAGVDTLSNRDMSMDICQWQMHPNGSFSPSSQTQYTLPPGVYNLDQDNDGRIYFIKSRPMTDRLLDLGETVIARVVESIDVFWNSKNNFTERGILFKRGILLWGPAGSGKTATVAMLIEKLVLKGGIVVICQNPKLCIKALRALRKIEPARPLIVIMEDIEEMIEHKGEHDLLSLLDGEHQVDNVVHLATTNYPERLGPRIVNRPSRFDEVIKVPMPDEQARISYFRHTLEDKLSEQELLKWGRETGKLSIAHLRELVVATQCLGRPFDETLDRLKQMVVRPKSSEGTSHPGMV